MRRLKEILVLLLLLLLALPAETFAQSAGGQISRKPKTAVKKDTPKETTPSKSTVKKPAAKRETCPPTPVAVDLGLPSGTLWADRNIGANSPEGYGDYFAWGETRPKSVYDWSTYKYCKGSEETMTKYCTKSSFGTVDNKTVLEAIDDAATANWGNSWRMPTREDIIELNEKCKWTWTTRNGVKGYKVVGPNGNSIFLPAAGDCGGSRKINTSLKGQYWTASLFGGYPSRVEFMSFDLDSRGNNGVCVRYDGCSVRAVARYKTER